MFRTTDIHQSIYYSQIILSSFRLPPALLRSYNALNLCCAISYRRSALLTATWTREVAVGKSFVVLLANHDKVLELCGFLVTTAPAALNFSLQNELHQRVFETSHDVAVVLELRQFNCFEVVTISKLFY